MNASLKEKRNTENWIKFLKGVRHGNIFRNRIFGCPGYMFCSLRSLGLLGPGHAYCQLFIQTQWQTEVKTSDSGVGLGLETQAAKLTNTGAGV